MRVMTSQYEISGKISVAQSKRFPSEVQSTRHRKKFIGTGSIFAKGKSPFLLTDFVFTLEC